MITRHPIYFFDIFFILFFPRGPKRRDCVGWKTHNNNIDCFNRFNFLGMSLLAIPLHDLGPPFVSADTNMNFKV